MIAILGLLFLISAVIWYYFFYHLLYSIKNDVDLKKAALTLLVLISAGILTCPYFVYMGWLPMYKKLQVERMHT